MSQIKLVRGEDWEGIYVNDELHHEGHRLGGETYLDLIHSYNSKLTGEYEVYYVDSDWLEDMGSLPEEFGEIPSGLLDLQTIKSS